MIHRGENALAPYYQLQWQIGKPRLDRDASALSLAWLVLGEQHKKTERALG